MSTSPELPKELMKQCTFVGTPLYVSPEMLSHSIACFSSDLWGLGCIIYQWIWGYPPFKGSTENIVFEEVLEWNIEIPADIDPDIEDLILCLLQINPLERLGGGDGDSGNDIDMLKKHPFFEGYSFDTIHQSVPPINSILQTEEDSLSSQAIDEINLGFDNIKL